MDIGHLQSVGVIRLDRWVHDDTLLISVVSVKKQAGTSDQFYCIRILLDTGDSPASFTHAPSSTLRSSHLCPWAISDLQQLYSSIHG
jgi:hypothetical protein